MLALAGGKGGCGKTTTACGLAGALVRAGSRPLVADADVDMPDLHDRVGAAAAPGLDALASGVPVERVLQTGHDLAGVDVVASGDVDSTIPALQRLAALGRPILVDCPAGAGPDAARPLQVAGRAVVVSTDTRASLEDAAKTAAMSRTLGTPIDCLVLRETPGGSDGQLDDRRLRRLVEAPAVVSLPHRPARTVHAAESSASPAPAPSPQSAASRRAFDALASLLYPSAGGDSTAATDRPTASSGGRNTRRAAGRTRIEGRAGR